jgi:hypothetical protein
VRTDARRDQRASPHEYLCIQASPRNLDAFSNRHNTIVNFLPNIHTIIDLRAYIYKTTNTYTYADFNLGGSSKDVEFHDLSKWGLQAAMLVGHYAWRD